MAERGMDVSQFQIPAHVQVSLAELEQELAEGDITRKGFEKKKAKLLEPYLRTPEIILPQGGPSDQGASSGAGRRSSRSRRREHHEPETRYRSETGRNHVREEAVKAALAKHNDLQMPLPSKRHSLHTNVVAIETPPESETDDDDSISSSSSHHTHEMGAAPSSFHYVGAEPGLNPMYHRLQPANGHVSAGRGGAQGTRGLDIASSWTGGAVQPPPDVTASSGHIAYVQGSSKHAEDGGQLVNSKVSAKIQQLLNTLKRPKRKPLQEFFQDEEEELEAANEMDPNAPQPEGNTITPAIGEQLNVPTGLPRNLEAAVQRYGTATPKVPVVSSLDANGKISFQLTYGKLLSRANKIAYFLLHKLGGKEPTLKPGDRVALVYPNSDPAAFMCAFYGCLFAGIVPVAIDVPVTRKDAGSQQIGFLLGGCGISVALTTSACLKELPKTQSGEVSRFKGWPKLTWYVTEHLSKPQKDWQIPPRPADDAAAYIEYTTDNEGSVMGVTVPRKAMLYHCRTLTVACSYGEGETMVNVLDFKRDVGLWHSVQASIFNGMQVYFVPYSLMKVNPASWMHVVTKYKATLAIVKSRDMHWGLMAQKEHKGINLNTLRMLLVADGANPWSLSSCDAFLNTFQSKGLKPEVLCPCACATEALTVSIRRPGKTGMTASGRGVLSMAGLSYGVVRVDTDDKLTSLTLQDVGVVMPGAAMVVVKIDGPPVLCKTDEIGELCVASESVGGSFWGLKGKTNATFNVTALGEYERPISEQHFVKTGLLGFLGPGGLVFVCGKVDGLMIVSGRRHNTDDIIATVLAVEPLKFIYRGRIGVFSIKVLKDERIIIIAEQRPEATEEECFQWMSRVLQAVDSIHQVGVYCLALVPPNSLPKTPLGGIHLSETKQRFISGALHPTNVLMCPHT
ncbi:disco-interacting protein 2 homolog C-like [Diadema antillarum]